MQAFVLSLYRLLTWALQPLVRLRLKRRAVKEPLYRQWIEERFGAYTQPSSGGWIWIHAVSLGETRAAAILLRELRQHLPGMRLLLTHGTATGREEGTKVLQEGDIQVWQPWDSARAARRFIAHFKPRIGILMETEVWPNLCAAASQAGVPMVLANARLSERSMRSALRLSALSAPAFASFTAVLAQTQADADRLKRVNARNIQIVGNLKFDVRLDAGLQQQGLGLKQHSAMPVLMLASSREGEESLFLDQILALAGKNTAQGAMQSIALQKVQWLIVPRHPQRFDAVQALCEQRGLSVSRRSQWADAPKPADVWLGNSMGEMALYYALADIALLGGSFAPLGGQNLMEAIAADCPIVMGPHTFNFQEACDTAQAMHAALRCTDMAHAVATAVHTLQSPQDMAQLHSHGQTWLTQSSGAAQRTAISIAREL